MEKRYYITTPIYYVNDRPHIGHAYTTIAADAVARYQRHQGRDAFLLTGTDEHGINIERIARARGVTPRAHADEVAGAFGALWRTLGISHDRFIRTTEPAHARAAIELWRRIQAAGDVYRDTYAGPYCPRCEAFYTEEELRDGACPIHGLPVETVEEENYFFRLSRYQAVLERLVRDTDFVQPHWRRNELLGILRGGLRDYSITRASVRWGIPVPEAPGEVFYVWGVDALANYLSGVGFPDDARTFAQHWPADVHLIGKEILRFHCLTWPALLLSARLPLPRRVFAHGWLTREGRKISKSLGNTIDTEALVREFGADAVRYYFLRAIPFGQDGDYTRAAFVARYNAELANNFGNLVQRVTALVSRSPRVTLAWGIEGREEESLRAAARVAGAHYDDAFTRLAIDEAIGAVMTFIAAANRYAESTTPWALARGGDNARLATVLAYLVEAARLASWWLWPVIPSTADAAHLRLCGERARPGLGVFGAVAPGGRIRTGPPLFPRLAA